VNYSALCSRIQPQFHSLALPFENNVSKAEICQVDDAGTEYRCNACNHPNFNESESPTSPIKKQPRSISGNPRLISGGLTTFERSIARRESVRETNERHTCCERRS